MYVKSTSFWRKETYLWEKSIHTFMKNREEEELINRAVLQGIYETQRIINPNEKLMINAPGHVIRNSEDNVNDLVNILSDPNLTKNDMIDKIIQEIMEPHQVDILVTGFFIHKPEEQLVTFCPMVIIRPYRDMIFRTIQIKKEDLKGTGIPGKNKIISEITYGLIVWTVQEMLGQVSDPSKWK